MKNLLIAFLFITYSLDAQIMRFDKSNLVPNLVSVSVEKSDGKDVLKVIKDSVVKDADEPTFVKIKNSNLENGIIEVKVLSRLTKTAPAFARGFIGVAFRINEQNNKFEAIYLRPTNGRADDQFRRNHSVQYFSYPDYKFDRLRKEADGVYETYADLGLDEWISMRIEVNGNKAKLYLNDQKSPSFIVNDYERKYCDRQCWALG